MFHALRLIDTVMLYCFHIFQHVSQLWYILIRVVDEVAHMNLEELYIFPFCLLAQFTWYWQTMAVVNRFDIYHILGSNKQC